MLLDQILKSLFLKEFKIVTLHVEDNLSTSGKFFFFSIFSNGESTSGTGLPSPLMFIIIGLRDNGNSFGNQISGIETDTKLSNHRNISTTGKGFHEGLSTGFGDGTEVIDQLLLGHTNTGIPNG